MASFTWHRIQTPNGEWATVVTGGFILTVQDLQHQTLLDIEADRAVVWDNGDLMKNGGSLQTTGSNSDRRLAFFLAGNVEIREQQVLPTGPPVSRIVRADQVYYDVSRSVAIAVRADMEFKQPGVPDPIHFRADECPAAVAHTMGSGPRRNTRQPLALRPRFQDSFRQCHS